MSSGREPKVIETFLALTDTLVGEFDAIDMLTMLCERTVDLLDVDAAGVILCDGHGGGLSVAAASSERTRLLEVFAVAVDAGPCVDCVRTGEAVSADDLTSDTTRARWPRFAAGAAEAGFRAAHALPMRLRGEVVGVLTLLHTDAHIVADPDARLGQALADAATIGLLHERAVRHAETLAQQLQSALNSRVVIEQAKGVLAARADIRPDEAFTVLRDHARSSSRRLTELCRDVVDGAVDLTASGRSAADRDVGGRQRPLIGGHRRRPSKIGGRPSSRLPEYAFSAPGRPTCVPVPAPLFPVSSAPGRRRRSR